jgi:uridine kinase
MDLYFYRGQDGGPTFVSPSTGETMPHNNHPNSADNSRLVADLDARCASSDAPDIVIVEGLMALHVPEIRERLDVRLFMDLDADVRALRRLLRDMAGGRGNTDAKFIATYYLECARVGHALYVEPSKVHADLILRGDADFKRTAPLIATLLRERLPQRDA